ncbi:hypothetical protein CHS0354_012367 [Potamilus streckersoni]|uniref:Uncharacterized protein n=1 Tax=Potamilus streckersoni TaxID=2493646 RepID=A0AAE0SKX2_9BIVA|nr:hypothetical protein CHS0354_012367 [Potamilus streckersoni]
MKVHLLPSKEPETPPKASPDSQQTNTVKRQVCEGIKRSAEIWNIRDKLDPVKESRRHNGVDRVDKDSKPSSFPILK